MAEEKYWLFDGKDAAGPFRPDELKKQPGFGPESLICPDGAESADLWKAAKLYLVKPPSGRSEPAKAPEPVRALPPVISIPEPVEPPAAAPSTPPTALALAAIVLCVGGLLAYMARSRHKRAEPAPVEAPAAVATPAPAPAAPAPEAVNAEAVEFVSKFPARSAGAPLPASAGDVLGRRKWRAAQTVGEALELKQFFFLAQDAALTLQKQGHTPEVGELELRRGLDRWEIYAGRWLKANYRLNWTTEPAGGDVVNVTAEARYRKGELPERLAFQADLSRRTLKPLNAEAWFALDPKACAKWGDANIRLGQEVDETKLQASAPAYPSPLPHHKQGLKPAAAPAVAAAGHSALAKPPAAARPPLAKPAPAKPAPAKAPAKPAKPAPATPPADEADYPDEAAGEQPPAVPEHTAAAPLTVATPPPAKKPAASVAPASTAMPGLSDGAARTADAKPAPAEPAAQPPAAKPAAQPPAAKPAEAPKAADAGQPPPAKPKSAVDMSPDELEQYLNRGKK